MLTQTKRKFKWLLLSTKVDFTRKNITRNKKGHFTMIKESFIKRYIAILNVYSLTNGASKCMKEIDRTARRNR